MRFLSNAAEMWQALNVKMKPALEKAGSLYKNSAEVMSTAWRYIVKLQKVILAVPVGVGAVLLAMKNLVELPDSVGLNLQSDGTFTVLIAREIAVLGPIAITALCLLLMFCAKRTLTPWLVSVFSLAIPLLILVTNVFPA